MAYQQRYPHLLWVTLLRMARDRRGISAERVAYIMPGGRNTPIHFFSDIVFDIGSLTWVRMRTLLLLLMACLLPLQLFAATLSSVPSAVASEPASVQQHVKVVTALDLPFASHTAQSSTQCSSGLDEMSASAQDIHLASSSHPAGDVDDRDSSTSQAELEDQTLPTQLATLQVPWLPFPHLFPTPLLSTSFVRDQLRPPPLA